MHHHHDDHQADFDEFYAGGRQWSGNPNAALIREVTGLPSGQVLDIGSGEGADAVWLADQGWQVTALEPAVAAVERARELAGQRGVGKQIAFEQTTLADFLPTAGEHSFDLICSFYFPAPVTPAEARALLRLLKPGGTLLWVDHDWEDARPERMAPDRLALLLDGLLTETTLRRDHREITHGAGAHHHEDLILRAVR